MVGGMLKTYHTPFTETQLTDLFKDAPVNNQLLSTLQSKNVGIDVNDRNNSRIGGILPSNCNNRDILNQSGLGGSRIS